MMRALGVIAVSILLPRAASAHLELLQPVSRYGANVLKDGPCGRAGGARSQNVTTFRAGETIEVRWSEYVDHPGHFRIAFDPDGDGGFQDPVCLAGCTTTQPQFQRGAGPGVLMDFIADTRGGESAVQVTLPNVACDRCTLQVIQVMYDKPPYTSPGNDIYYQCADLVLVASAQDGGVTPRDAASGEPDTSVGCACVRHTEPGDAWRAIALAAALVAVARRRR